MRACEPLIMPGYARQTLENQSLRLFIFHFFALWFISFTYFFNILDQGRNGAFHMLLRIGCIESIRIRFIQIIVVLFVILFFVFFIHYCLFHGTLKHLQMHFEFR
jgi:hypothetical protein